MSLVDGINAVYQTDNASVSEKSKIHFIILGATKQSALFNHAFSEKSV